MRRVVKAVAAAACAFTLGACVIASHHDRPQPVADQPDTFRFRVFPAAVIMPATFADRAAADEIARFRLARGYASSEIVSRDERDQAFVYTVRFAR